MSKFRIEPSFWQLFPQCEIGVVVLHGIDNSEAGSEPFRRQRIGQLENANREAKKYLTGAAFSQNPVVAIWRQAFTQFKTRKGARSSIEALLKRIEKGNAVGPINPLVDIYNTVSLRYGLPCGGEDLDCFAGDLRLTVTAGGDGFLALGDEESDPTLPGEVCYLDDQGAVCRCWNWRDGQRTMLTEGTKNAVLVIESVDPSRHADLLAALDLLAKTAVQYLGGQAATKILTRDAAEIDLAGQL
ncbi:MAG: B3/4 domain-containing protein [Negativicutes bacterium]|nr:B3/4 domain-containing protein [Negativicutes bacterium]